MVTTIRHADLNKLPDAEISYVPDFLPPALANSYFEDLFHHTPWRQDPITIFGKTHPQPRLTSLHAHTLDSYSYSGIVMTPHPMTETLKLIENRIYQFSDASFTTVLLNLYRDGKDSNGWHADDESELGKNPVIASVSLGAPRFFHLRHNHDPKQRYKLLLEHGSLLLMGGATQHFWKHQVAKTAKKVDPRINLTFRKVRHSN
jgi:alkylated DNA repair dioxygenase AlkB